MSLVDEGRLALDAPLIDYIPDLELADSAVRDRITLRHLLSHTGGFWGDYYTDQGFGDDALTRSLPGFRDLTQRHAPGDLWTYCNAGFNLAGIAIERLLDMTYEAATRRHIFEPLGLEHSFFFPHEAICYPVSVGHVQVKPGSGEHRVARRYHLPRVNNPDGGIISTVGDLLTFAAFHMGDGTTNGARVLSAASMAEMQRPQVEAVGWVDAWGLGWHIINAVPHRLIGHDGSTIGFQSLLTLVPQQQFAIICLTNSSRGTAAALPITTWALAHNAGIEIPALVPIDMSAEELARFAGQYQNEWTEARVTVAEGGLDLVLTRRSPFAPGVTVMPVERLVPVGARSFVFTSEAYHRRRVDFIWYGNHGDPHPRFFRMGRLFDRLG
jgi:CubicO group peptidase (beta-lactamase class C family)